MKKTIQLALGLALLAGLLAAPASMASNKIAKKESGMVCTSCHDKPGSKLLTDQGKYYESQGSLHGFDELEEEFQRCTYCHSRKPGSEKLTKVGKRYQWMFQDMDGIQAWLQQRHPTGDGDNAKDESDSKEK